MLDDLAGVSKTLHISSPISVPCRNRASASTEIRWRANGERDETLRGVAVAREFGSDLQRIELSCQILAGHLIIDAVAVVGDGTAKLPFRFGPRRDRG